MTNEKENTNNQKPELKVVVKYHKQLLEILEKPRLMWRAMLLLFLVLVIIFIGLTFFALTLKRFFPYSVIETNLQGATYVKNEDKEVIYWLFNTADLWANSGIEVKKGDELTIRASGASYTAIHHLVKASNENSIPRDNWVETDGQKRIDSRDDARLKHRISKSSDEGILLMQIIPAQYQNNNKGWVNREDTVQWFLTNGNIEVIGKERRNLLISQDGILHFAVNDIVLTDTILNLMYCEWIDSIGSTYIIKDSVSKKNNVNPKDSVNQKDSIETVKALFCNIKKRGEKSIKELADLRDSINCAKLGKDSTLKICTEIGRYPVIQKKNKCGIDSLDYTYYNAYPVVNELVYYKQKGYRTPWYEDNLGSFLIVIERKRP